MSGDDRGDLDLRGADVAAARRGLPEAQLKHARQVLARAKAVGEEYTGVQVATATVRTRRAGYAIVDEARRRGVEAIVLGAEEPSTDPRRGAAGRPRRPGGLRRGHHQVRRQQGELPRDRDGARRRRTPPWRWPARAHRTGAPIV